MALNSGLPFKYWWLRHSEGAALYSGLGGSGATEYSGSPVKAFSEWIKDINELVADKLVPVLHENDMIVPDLSNYCTENYNLINIADFNSLIAQSQLHNTPVFLLTQEQIEKSGKVWANMKKNRDDFNDTFTDFANRIIKITN